MPKATGVLASPVAAPYLNLSLFSHLKRVIHFDAEVSDGTLEFGVAEQYLDRSEIFRSPVNQRCLSATHRVGSIRHGVKANGGYPSFNDACILPCRQMI